MAHRRYGTHRKPRQLPAHQDQDAWSTQSRVINKLIGQELYSEAFVKLDAALTDGASDQLKADVLNLSADALFAQGKFAEADNAYAQALLLARNDSLAKARSSIGRLRSLLKNVQVTDALTLANAFLNDTVVDWQTYCSEVAQAQSATNGGQVATVPPQPIRPTVVASRIAKQFFDEGEVEAARNFWNQSVALEPAGATKARIGLAEIYLRNNLPSDASAFANQALQIGKFQKKTLSAWTILIKANQLQGIAGVDTSLLQKLQSIKATVRARAIFCIVRCLRSHGDPVWKDIAIQWLQNNNSTKTFIIAAELKKLLLSSPSSAAQGSSSIAGAASALIQTANVTPLEWTFAIKQMVASALATNTYCDWQALVQQGVNTFGEIFRSRLTHAVARTFIKASRSDLAQPLLENALSSLPNTDSVWGKSAWSLASLKESFSDFTAAANLYQLISQNPSTASRFRVQAKVRWVRSLIASGQTSEISSAVSEISSILVQSQDHRLLLDCSRQLYLGSPELKPLADTLFSTGETLAKQMLQAATSSEEAATLSAIIALRQSDLNKPERVVQDWETLSPQRRLWLWSTKKEHWEYLGLVVRSYIRLGQASTAETLVNQYLQDPATPVDGIAILGVRWGLYKISKSQLAAAIPFFERAAALSPNNINTVYAFYWLALKSYTDSDTQASTYYASRIRAIAANQLGIGWLRSMVARSICIAANLQRSSLPTNELIPFDELSRELNIINGDLMSVLSN